ncbi:MAG: LacI family DNA-binding transcriptional regulator [Candidatus Acidiferrales bacterium]
MFDLNSCAKLLRMVQNESPSESPTIDSAPSDSPVNLKSLAGYLGLSQATVSVVMNGSPVADSIPQNTKDRVLAAVRRFNYRPNHVARSLRRQRSSTIGVVVPEVSEGYAALVMSGIEDHLLQSEYFYFVMSHHHKKDLLKGYAELFLKRSVDGLITLDTHCSERLPIPVVSVSGHGHVEGVTNVVLNHSHAAFLALQHLVHLGHRDIAFIKGQDFTSDTKPRWNAIVAAARKLKLRIDQKLVGRLEGESSSPEVGYRITKKILAACRPFTALFAFNDIAAIGAISALREAGLRIPHDISVVGFDDIQCATYQHPGLTTIRQPLRKMGEIAAQTTVRRIANRASAEYQKLIVVEPELVVRGSTGYCPPSG